MTNNRRINPRLREDLELVPEPGGPVRYAHTTDKPVTYVEVANEHSGVIGFLWACDADDAAGWQRRPAAGEDAFNAGSYWIAKLLQAKASGLTPSQALAQLASDPGNIRVGVVVPDSEATAESYPALKAMATEE